MIVLPLLMDLWTMLAAMILGGVALALLDRVFPTWRFPVGLGVLGAVFVEEIGYLLYAHFYGNDDGKALYLILPMALFFIAAAMVYGITKAAFWALPQRSKSP
jgi:hypothetical protein